LNARGAGFCLCCACEIAVLSEMASVKPVQCRDVLRASVSFDPSERSLRFPGLPDPSRGRFLGHHQRYPVPGG
jgi:hypothetical protein